MEAIYAYYNNIILYFWDKHLIHLSSWGIPTASNLMVWVWADEATLIEHVHYIM